MRYTYIFLLFLSVQSLFAQADTIFVIGTQYGNPVAVNDSTFNISNSHTSDQLGEGYLPTQIRKNYLLIDINGRVFRVDSIISANFTESQLLVVEQQDDDQGPVGYGVIFRSPSNSNCIPRIPVGNTGLSPALETIINNHNVVNGCGVAGGGGDVTAAILTDSMAVIRDSIAAVRADIGSGGGTVSSVVAGTDISVNSTDPANPIVTNTAPDQTVSITGAGSVAVTGTYPNFTATGNGVTSAALADSLMVLRSRSTEYVVDQNGNGDFYTLSGAVDTIQTTYNPGIDNVILIRVNPGVYVESTLRIDSSYINIFADALGSVIWKSNYASASGPASFAINTTATNVSVTNLVIENTESSISSKVVSITGEALLNNCSIKVNGQANYYLNLNNANATAINNIFTGHTNTNTNFGGVIAEAGTLLGGSIFSNGRVLDIRGGTVSSALTLGSGRLLMSAGELRNVNFKNTSNISGGSIFSSSFEWSINQNQNVVALSGSATFTDCVFASTHTGAGDNVAALAITAGGIVGTFRNCSFIALDDGKRALRNSSGVSSTVVLADCTFSGRVDWTDIVVSDNSGSYSYLKDDVNRESVYVADHFTNDRDQVDYGSTIAGGSLLIPTDVALTGTEGLFFAHNTSNHFKGHDGTSLYRFPKYLDVAATDGQVGVYDLASDRWVPTTIPITAELYTTTTNFQDDNTASSAGKAIRTVYGDSEVAFTVTDDPNTGTSGQLELSVYDNVAISRTYTLMNEAGITSEAPSHLIQSVSGPISLYSTSGLKETRIQIQDSSAIIVTATAAPNFAGIEYAENYANKFKPLSLITKAYADSLSAQGFQGSITLPDSLVSILTSDGAGIEFNADNVNLVGTEVTVNGQLIPMNDTLVVPVYCHPHGEAVTTGSDYRGWRVPADLDGARLIGVHYSFDTPGSDTALIQLGNGTVNVFGATIPATGYITTTAVRTLVADEKWTPSIGTLNGTGHEGLMLNLIIERNR